MDIKPLIWTDEQNANDEIRYTHVKAYTPFGRFVITWKGWKECDYPTIDETPWGEFGGVEYDLESAKALAEAEYFKRVGDCLAP